MNMLVALLTEGFSESNWTDQEVGIAIGRRVPILSVSRGKDPYGFIGKYQAIQWGSKTGEQVADKILGVLLKTERFTSLTKGAFITGVSNAYSFARANELALLLPKIDHLSPEQEEALVLAFNSNDQVYNARGFYPALVKELERITGNIYWLRELGYMFRQIELVEDIPF